MRKFEIGLLVRAGSCWVGIHWSGHNRRLCINLLPMVTLYLVLAGGVSPKVPNDQ